MASTDWERVAALYAELSRLAPSPVVELNRAVAIAMAEGIPAGLALMPATRADLLRRGGHAAEARAAYEEALRLAPTEPERRYLAGRLRAL